MSRERAGCVVSVRCPDAAEAGYLKDLMQHMAQRLDMTQAQILANAMTDLHTKLASRGEI